MEIKWEVDDNYAGGGRPQYTEIDDDEFEDGMMEGDVSNIINDAVLEDFEHRISWSCKDFDRYIKEGLEIVRAKGGE